MPSGPGRSKSYAVLALEIIGFDALLNLYDRHAFAGNDYSSNLTSIRDNLHGSWTVDNDPYNVSQIGHPNQVRCTTASRARRA